MVNVSVGVFVGEPVTVGEDVRVTIDCSPLIDEAINNGILNPTVTWFKDRAELSNGSAPNVEISADRRRLIITNTSLAVGGRLGTEGNYTCKVKNRISSSRVCGELLFSLLNVKAIMPLFLQLKQISCNQ